VLFLIATFFATDFIQQGALPWVLAGFTAVALLVVGGMLLVRRPGWAFALMGATIALLVAFLMSGLYPRVMVSSTDPAYSLTIYNASSTQYTLWIMSIVAAVMIPVVLAYQIWSYWVFRKRLTRKDVLEY
jgi:cytochrome bd ubiquinol oxidase subunit II